MNDSDIVHLALSIIERYNTISPTNKGAIKPPVKHRNRKHYSTIHKDYDYERIGGYPETVDLADGTQITIPMRLKIKPLVLNDCELSIVPDMYRTGKECYKLASVSGGISTDLDLHRFTTRQGAYLFAKHRLGVIPWILC